MDKQYKGKDGISIKLITNKIDKEISRIREEKEEKKDKKKDKKKLQIRRTYQKGTLKSDDWKKITTGVSILHEAIYDGMDSQRDKLAIGNEDVSKTKLNIWNFRYIIEDSIRRLYRLSDTEAEAKYQMEVLNSYSDIAQAARDGIILKQETRKEIVDGKEKEIIYDTSMTDKEVIRKFEIFEKLSQDIDTKKIKNYIELGFGVAGILGTVAKTIAEPKKENRTDKKGTTIGLVTVAASAIPLIGDPNWRKKRDKGRELTSKTHRLIDNAIFNEQISINAKEDAIDVVQKANKEEWDWKKRQGKNEAVFETSIQTVVALITGMYINSKIKINENGKIDGKSLASALLSVQATKGALSSTIRAIGKINDMKTTNNEYEEAYEEIRDILLQMEEKVYPLEGAKKTFEKLEVKDFEGKFYPKKNYETGEVTYATKLHIPEFSMEKGETVLLSGESGTGKSTFLRLLKRGDINNQKCIKLDGKDEVDSLGNQYISFRPDIKLGNETNVLFQITGKESVSELDDKEKINLLKIMKELELDSGLKSKELLEQMASKKFMEYSTGQQKRLSLSKLFYRINDGASAIIVDEPVGNVEDRLIRQQLEMIKKYAKEQDVMLLLVTHRVDAVKDLVDKRYNIDNNGLMTQMPIIKEEKDINEENEEQR